MAAVKAITSLKKGGRRRRARLATIAKVKRKMRAAAYTVGGVDYAKLFKHYDRDNSGTLEFDEFRSALRRDAKIAKKDVTDEQMKTVFDAVDEDGGGEIDVEPRGFADKAFKARLNAQQAVADADGQFFVTARIDNRQGHLRRGQPAVAVLARPPVSGLRWLFQ